MRLLLDTHAFLWWATAPHHLSLPARKAISDPQSEVFVSAACVWEISIKSSLNRLQLSESWRVILDREVEENGFRLLSITFRHIERLGALEPLHKDPFDRILMAQALDENLSMVSADAWISQYEDLRVVW